MEFGVKEIDGEPVFVLRAQDRIAANVIRFWAGTAQQGGSPHAKIGDALRDADRFDAWAAGHPERVKQPD